MTNTYRRPGKLFVDGERIIYCGYYIEDGCKTTYESKIKQKFNFYLLFKKNILR